MVDIEEVIKWLQENYQTIDMLPTSYRFTEHTSDTIDMSIVSVHPPKVEGAYTRRYSASIESICHELRKHFKK